MKRHSLYPYLAGWLLLLACLSFLPMPGRAQELSGDMRTRQEERIKDRLRDFYDNCVGACMNEEYDFIEAIEKDHILPGGAFKPDFGKFNEDGLWSFRNYCDNFIGLYGSMFETGEMFEFRQSDFRFLSLKMVDGGNNVEANFTYTNRFYVGEQLIASAQEVEAYLVISMMNPLRYRLKQIVPNQGVTVHYSPEEEKTTPQVVETPKEEAAPLVEVPKEETVVPLVETPTMDGSEQQADGEINGHEYVDLGLSVKWATCNVGASSPSDYGDYFAWGETRPKSEYTEENSVTYEKSFGDIGGNAQYDAARANWGGSWRLPTKDELIELKEKCKWTWTTQGGHNGYKVVGPSGKSIFLPAAGWRLGTSLYGVGERGLYWSSTPYESVARRSYRLYFYSSSYDWFWGHRSGGHSVRPVSD